MLNAEQAVAAENALVYPAAGLDKTTRAAMIAEYKAGKSKIQEEFLNYLEEQYATSEDSDVLAMLRLAAWSDGHGSGYQNVEHHYSEYAELSDQEILELDF